MDYIKPISILLSVIVMPAVAEIVDCQDGDTCKMINQPVVVTATRWETTGIPTAGSITIITRDDIIASGAQRITDVLRGQGGLQIQDFTGDGSRAMIDLRGFGSTGAANTLILVDGRRLNPTDLSGPNLNLIALKDVERIEISKGSNTVLFGDQAVGGVINIITRRPQKLEIDIDLAYGSYDYQSQIVKASHRHENGLGGRITGERKKSDNYRDNSALDFTNGYAQLSYDWSEGNFFADITRTDEDIQLPGALFPTELAVSRKQSTDTGAFNDSTSESLRLGGSWSLSSNWDIAGEFTVRNDDVEGALAFGGVLFPFTQKRLHRSLNPRIRGKVPIGKNLITLIVGGDIEESDYSIEGITLTNSTQSMRSFYALATVPVNEAVSLTGGLRKAWLENDIVDGFRFPSGALLEDNQTVSTLGISFIPLPDWRIALKREENYRFPLIDEETNFFGFQQTLQTQTGESYEGVVEWRHKYFFTKLLLYKIKLENELIFNPVTFVNENLDPTERQGLIYELSLIPVDNLVINAQYGYTDAVFREGVFKDKEIPLVAKHQLLFGMTYQFASHWTLHGNIHLLSERILGNDFSNSAQRLPGYGMGNIHLRFDNGRFFASAGIRNILDKKYNSTGTLAFNFANFMNEPAVFPAPERNFLLTGGIHF